MLIFRGVVDFYEQIRFNYICNYTIHGTGKALDRSVSLDVLSYTETMVSFEELVLLMEEMLHHLTCMNPRK